jgi:glycosyltransferase involved in cell wall biosynthesis
VAVETAHSLISPAAEVPYRLGFITAIPQTVHGGSGCYVGIGTLAAGLVALGSRIEMIKPRRLTGSFILDRYIFNQTLRFRRPAPYDATVGFDLDGFAGFGPRNIPHVANIKGVLADAVPFEHGMARARLALQARWEKQHAHRADLVITTSEYCRGRLHELYGVREPIAIVPEPIDLETWRRLFKANPAPKPLGEFTVLSVCRFYPRKRLELLLWAADILRTQIPGFKLRIVGHGPEARPLLHLWRKLRLEPIVTWVGEVPRHELAREYNRADLFCLPSVQEGFGIVFLEAMAAGKAIVAARAAAVPEVVQRGTLVEPDNAEALADGIYCLGRDPGRRRVIVRQQLADVEEYDMTRVASRFLREISRVVARQS